MQPILSVQELRRKAKEFEDNNDMQSAAEQYHELLKVDATNEFAFDRLMIIYRKLKDPKKELDVINKAIKEFEKHYKAKKSRSKKVNEVSEKLNKVLGLVDKLGVSVYEPEPIAGWRKRKEVVEKKMGKVKKMVKRKTK